MAILSVVAFHAFPAQFPGGFVGVDVFFVISGYLITRIIAGNLASGTFSFAEFYARRVRRIFPALLLVLTATFALGGMVLTSEDYRLLTKHAIAGATFTSNFLLWQESGYFDTASDLKPFLHLWSLGIEEQFYLLWPLLAYLAWKFRLNIAWAAAILGSASFLGSAYSVINDPDAAFYSPASRMWELMIGCALAARQMSAKPGTQRPVRADVDAAVGLLLILIAIWLLDRDRVFPGGWALMPTLGAALLLQSGPNAWINRTIFAHKAMVNLGLVSYALYLWHWPLLAMLNVLNPEGAPAMIRLAATLLALVLSWCTYQFVEKKIRLHGGRIAVPALIGASFVVILAAVGAYTADLGPDQALEARLRESRRWPQNDVADRSCRERLAVASYCSIDKPDIAPTHALIGDSHANHFFPGLAAEIGKAGGNLIHFGAAGCAPLYGVESSHATNCRAIIDKAIEYVLADRHIQVVILAANWHAYARGGRFSAYQNRQVRKMELTSVEYPEGTDRETVFATALRNTVDRLTGGGKRVVILEQVPELAIRFETCLEKLRTMAPGAWDTRVCAVPRRKVDQYVGEYTGLIDAAVSGNGRASVLDPLRALCDKDFCRVLHGPDLLYRDDVHLSLFGSGYVARLLWRAATGSVAAP